MLGVCGQWMVRVSHAGCVWSVDGEGAPCWVCVVSGW